MTCLLEVVITAGERLMLPAKTAGRLVDEDRQRATREPTAARIIARITVFV